MTLKIMNLPCPDDSLQLNHVRLQRHRHSGIIDVTIVLGFISCPGFSLCVGIRKPQNFIPSSHGEMCKGFSDLQSASSPPFSLLPPFILFPPPFFPLYLHSVRDGTQNLMFVMQVFYSRAVLPTADLHVSITFMPIPISLLCPAATPGLYHLNSLWFL